MEIGPICINTSILKKKINQITVYKDRKRRAWHLEYSVGAERFDVGAVAVRLCRSTKRSVLGIFPHTLTCWFIAESVSHFNHIWWDQGTN